jgi:hypothetical protein
MDSASISALAALGGALLGDLTPFAAARVTQQTQVLDKNRLLHICCRVSANNFATMM